MNHTVSPFIIYLSVQRRKKGNVDGLHQTNGYDDDSIRSSEMTKLQSLSDTIYLAIPRMAFETWAAHIRHAKWIENISPNSADRRIRSYSPRCLKSSDQSFGKTSIPSVRLLPTNPDRGSNKNIRASKEDTSLCATFSNSQIVLIPRRFSVSRRNSFLRIPLRNLSFS